jgi:DNA-binding GntR family transcriptional regulator
MRPFRLQSVEEKGLSNWVTNSLREAILSGSFNPGEKLDQDLIASELNVSRTPIREALKVLESEGFVEIRSYRGVYIPILSEQDIHDVYEIRWVLEPEIARQAAPGISDSAVAHMGDLIKEMEVWVTGGVEAAESGKDRRMYVADQEFHTTIARYCPNNLFVEILDKLNNRIVRVRNFAMHLPGDHLEESHQEHIGILKAVEMRDAQLSSRLMELHLKNSARRLMEYIRG